MFSGSNLPRVGTYNINVVLSSVQAADGISRVEIAQQTGLTAQTVSVIVRRLIEQGIVIESGSLASTGGKPRTTLRINPTAAYAIGIHFDPIEVSVVVVDMKGQQLVHSRHAISPRLEPEALIAEAATVARKHLADLGIADERVLGVGAACPGRSTRARAWSYRRRGGTAGRRCRSNACSSITSGTTSLSIMTPMPLPSVSAGQAMGALLQTSHFCTWELASGERCSCQSTSTAGYRAMPGSLAT